MSLKDQMVLKITKKRTGEQNPFFGRHHSEESKRMMREKHKEYYKTHPGYWTGKKRSEETIKKMSKNLKGRVSPMKGKHLTFEQRKILSEQRLRMKSPFWKGGKSGDRGYVRIIALDHSMGIKTPYKFEHRIVVEKYLGRSLKKGEPVHHINGIRDDNRKKNLMAFESISAHRRYGEGKKVSPAEIIFDGRN